MLPRSPALAGLLFLLLAAPCLAQGDAKRGEYLAKAGGCLGCHTVEAKDGATVFSKEQSAKLLQWGADEKSLLVDGVRISLP